MHTYYFFALEKFRFYFNHLYFSMPSGLKLRTEKFFSRNIHLGLTGIFGPIMYCAELDRLYTYPAKWPNSQSKEDLVRSGFYSVGGSNTVECFACKLRINTSPHEFKTIKDIHKEKKPDCPMNSNPLAVKNVTMKHTNIYKCERDRLYSFLIANFEWPVNIHDLAKAGFYYDPIKKSSCCFFCKLQIGSWTHGDTGNSEHLKYSPQCAFYKKMPGVENVPIGQEDTPEAKKIIEAAILDVSPTFEQPLDIAKKIKSVTEEAKHPRYREKRERISSFATWPASLKQRPGELAEAGFYYSSRGDRVICYQCGGGLRDWDVGDRPWNEHAFWFQTCPLVNAVMGKPFIRKVIQMKETMQKKSTISVVINPEGPDEDDNAMQTDHEISADLINEDVREYRQCKVCLSKELGIVFLPCAHMATCPDCAPQLTLCPICRSQFTAYVRAFLPR